MGLQRLAAELHLERHRILPATDPSNHNRRFLRVRVREELLPLLAERFARQRGLEVVELACGIAQLLTGTRDV